MNPHYTFVAVRAHHICEYCHAPEAVFNLPFEVEHIMPQSIGGETSESNLALSCRSCNLYKSDVVLAFDQETQKDVRLFNPRLDVWSEHFFVISETGNIEALTGIARATLRQLRINSSPQLAARKEWLKLGFFS